MAAGPEGFGETFDMTIWSRGRWVVELVACVSLHHYIVCTPGVGLLETADCRTFRSSLRMLVHYFTSLIIVYAGFFVLTTSRKPPVVCRVLV